MNIHKQYFITGISTEVGKTICSAIFVRALNADYWKPIQSGDLDFSDSDKIKEWLDIPVTIHPNSYALKTPISPHAAASIDGVSIDKKAIIPPQTTNPLVIEGAGGVLVPINSKETIADIIYPHYKLILVSRHYLGSINHTLMTVEILRYRGIVPSGIVFSGQENKETENIIQQMTGLTIIGRISEESSFDSSIITKYANLFQSKILSL